LASGTAITAASSRMSAYCRKPSCATRSPELRADYGMQGDPHGAVAVSEMGRRHRCTRREIRDPDRTPAAGPDPNPIEENAMLVAPFTGMLPDARSQPIRQRTLAIGPSGSPFALAIALGWLAVGGLLMAFLPHSHIGTDFGATLPFWLVGAPLIDLAWLMRRRAGSVLARVLCELSPDQPRGARRFPARELRIPPARRLRSALGMQPAPASVSRASRAACVPSGAGTRP
jgi:hypothetical protein